MGMVRGAMKYYGMQLKVSMGIVTACDDRGTIGCGSAKSVKKSTNLHSRAPLSLDICSLDKVSRNGHLFKNSQRFIILLLLVLARMVRNTPNSSVHSVQSSLATTLAALGEL